MTTSNRRNGNKIVKLSECTSPELTTYFQLPFDSLGNLSWLSKTLNIDCINPLQNILLFVIGEYTNLILSQKSYVVTLPE